MEKIALSVRELVEFTLHGEDITPQGSIRDMQDGALGHKARQKLLGEGWQAEVPLKAVIPVEEEEAELHLAGRMDAFRDGDVPEIEEIKLWQGKDPPEECHPAHMAQAETYAWMLCRQRETECVDIRVVYVSRSGAVRAVFPERLTAEEIENRFTDLLLPWLRRFRTVRAHTRARDASIRALPFPYPAYRAGQREMAAQVYTAVRLRRRLFASMPTGTGKTAAALFPALKALGNGLTERLYLLTARTTQRQSALDAVARMRTSPLHLWTLTLDARDRQCPMEHRVCDPEHCARAKGHYLRDSAAIDEMLAAEDWSPSAIREMSDKHLLCPFEFSLSLAELADLTICDYNYALDPAVHIRRIFDHPGETTLLIDEAHNLPDRVREMLSGRLDGRSIKKLRTAIGKKAGRAHSLYKALTGMLNALADLPAAEEEREGVLDALPQSVTNGVMTLTDAFLDVRERLPLTAEEAALYSDVLSGVLSFRLAAGRDDVPYAWLWQGRKTRSLQALALDIAPYFEAVTARMCGTVCFSATLSPLTDMRRVIGGTEEDACFAMPSPFPRENLLVVQQDVNVRYANRQASLQQVADSVTAMVNAKEGRYIAFFPSFAYMEQAAEHLSVPFQMQRRAMSIPERDDFLTPYREAAGPCLSLCVMGGVFGESIDLPGDALDGVCIVGVGLPQVGLERETLRGWYQEHVGDGFRYAYQIPGMQRLAQAAGRVVRTETDRGVVVLLDDRLRQNTYRSLCPAYWEIRSGDLKRELAAFWGAAQTEGGGGDDHQ